MHRWLVQHGWVLDSPSIGARVISYIAFFFVPGCVQFALLQWFLGRVFSGNADQRR